MFRVRTHCRGWAWRPPAILSRDSAAVLSVDLEGRQESGQEPPPAGLSGTVAEMTWPGKETAVREVGVMIHFHDCRLVHLARDKMGAAPPSRPGRSQQDPRHKSLCLAPCRVGNPLRVMLNAELLRELYEVTGRDAGGWMDCGGTVHPLRRRTPAASPSPRTAPRWSCSRDELSCIVLATSSK